MKRKVVARSVDATPPGTNPAPGRHPRTPALHDAHVRTWLRELIAPRLLRLARQDDGGCWTWTGAVNGRSGRDGLRSIPVWALPLSRRKGISVRPLAAAIAGMSLAPGQVVQPRCGNHLCVCPDHMRAVTRKQMAKAAVAAGRIRTGPTTSARHLAASRAQPHVKLTLERVRELRARYAETGNAALCAREFGISPQHAHRIVTGVWWREPSPFQGLMR